MDSRNIKTYNFIFPCKFATKKKTFFFIRKFSATIFKFIHNFIHKKFIQNTSFLFAGVTLANLLHIFFDSYSTNTQNTNVTTLKINVTYKSTLFLATQYIQLITHYFDFESKKLCGNMCRSNEPPKINWKWAQNESLI